MCVQGTVESLVMQVVTDRNAPARTLNAELASVEPLAKRLIHVGRTNAQRVRLTPKAKQSGRE